MGSYSISNTVVEGGEWQDEIGNLEHTSGYSMRELWD